HLQSLRSADLFSESADGLRVENVAAKQIRGHGQVIADEETHSVGFLRRQLQARKDFFDCFEAAHDVIVAGHSLADVVEEQRKKKELGSFQVGKNLRERALPRLRRLG